MPTKQQLAAQNATEVQTSALDSSDVAAAAVEVTIPPLPGGGSWKWTGTAWESNEPPAEEQVAPLSPTEE